MNYLAVADEIEAHILDGRLAVGERLPPQRTFAFERKIAPSTAARVYRELVARRLVTGEVGRGTYVRDPRDRDRTLLQSAASGVDMAVNYPVLDDQADGMAPVLRRMARPELLSRIIRKGPEGRLATGPECERMLRTLDLPEDRDVLLTGSGRQAIGCAIEALVPPSGALAVEEWTYPITLKLARRLGRKVVPIAMDKDGIVPDAVRTAHARTPFSHLYVQPTIHNPTTATLPITRRQELIATATTLGVTIIEDRTYRFLSDELPSLAELDPAVVTIDSFSKRLAPGLTLGAVTNAGDHMTELEQVALEMGWTASAFAMRAADGWIADGTVDRVTMSKRDDAARRRATVRSIWPDAGAAVRCGGYHVWLTLSEGGDTERVRDRLAARNVAITAAEPYAAAKSNDMRHLRVALSKVPFDQLTPVLRIIHEECRLSDKDRIQGVR